MTEEIKKVLVPIANGSEDIESVAIIDILRRAGADVTVASIEKENIVTLARGTKVVADKNIGECTNTLYDAIALPGGMPGAERLRDCKTLIELLHKHKQGDKFIAAICATPAVVLQTHGFIDSKNATCHPSFAKNLINASHVESRVVVDGKLITSRSPGTAIEFALKIVEVLYSREKAAQIATPMLVQGVY